MNRPELDRPGRVLAIVAVVAVAAAVWQGLAWHRAAPEDLPAARDRDTVLADAKAAITALTTLDATDPKGSIASWKQVSTGSLGKAIATGSGGYQQLFATGKVSASPKIRDAAVQALRRRQGTAKVLIGLDVTLDAGAGKSTVERIRIKLTMTRVGAGWKASKLETVGV